MDFSHQKSPNTTRVVCDEGVIRIQVVRNPSHTENHTKSRILYTCKARLNHDKYTEQKKVEDHENHVRWIYLTTVLNTKSDVLLMVWCMKRCCFRPETFVHIV